MKAVVVGLGSMGKRRIRLMREFFSEINVCGVDTNEQRRAQTAEQFQVECYASLKEAVTAAPDIGFVCTSPLSHSAIIKEMLENNINVFTEINLVSDGYEKNCALAQKKGLELFLSSTPIYRRETQYIERRAQEAQCPLFYRYHVGQYLPDWHPWENYRDFFVGDRRTNGCREIFGIELPWLVRAFGDIESTAEVKARQSSLVIDYADSYLVTLSHSSGICGQLAVDIVSRKAVRDFELFGEKLYLRWGGT
ncbi:MAG: Gfo/Idh/MocA family oxidoreductase, partial [Oscillospiraceae bacterium]